MAVLSTGGPTPPPTGPAPRRVLLVSRDEELDSLLAGRRVAAHLAGLEETGDEARPGGDGPPPDVALVCDDDAATRRLLELGVPVVRLSSGHRAAVEPAADRALHRVHRPGWLPGPWPATPGGARTTGVLAPARSARGRDRHGSLLLLSLWGVPDAEADPFTSGPLRQLAAEAVRRTQRCEVVCDTRLDRVRDALEGLDGVRVRRAADTDVDALHAGTELLLAAPTLGAVALAQARRAPLALLPPLGDRQRDLAERVARAVPVPVAADPHDPSLWAPGEPGAPDPWAALDGAADDLRGAQRVARTLRQLSLAPL
ncbi:CGA synthase-related protein [Streptomyces sp. NPDC002855]|uniref:CGA synthase-related protein n=1 Tax=Streptomyces sp. NPDC002855 TaxID=3154437 RepID=UPI00332EC782